MEETDGQSAEEMGVVSSPEVLQSFGAKLLDGSRTGVKMSGWTIESRKGAILKSGKREEWEQQLSTTHLPEMLFGSNALILCHEPSGLTLSFNAFDALRLWRREGLPPVQVAAAAKWKERTRPSKELVMDYDYTYTTGYAGSDEQWSGPDTDPEAEATGQGRRDSQPKPALAWRQTEEKIDLAALQARDPILFYDEVILYEDELSDNGISLLTVKVRVMPRFWFVLLRFWLRVDGALMRVRDCRMFCPFSKPCSGTGPLLPSAPESLLPHVIRERIHMEDSFEALAQHGYPADAAFYDDANKALGKLTIHMTAAEELHVCSS